MPFIIKLNILPIPIVIYFIFDHQITYEVPKYFSKAYLDKSVFGRSGAFHGRTIIYGFIDGIAII